jgi:hypothetical protein
MRFECGSEWREPVSKPFDGDTSERNIWMLEEKY